MTAELERVDAAARQVSAAKTERELAILAAYDAGASLREIGRAAGVSHQRVAQIINGTKEEA